MVLHRSMVDWWSGWGQSAMKLMQCSGFPEIYACLQEEIGVSLPWVYVHSAIYETYLV